MQKLYAYIDETGQDTEGRFFLAGFLRDSEEGQVYTRDLFKRFLDRHFIIKLK